jgi:hypothetical protein
MGKLFLHQRAHYAMTCVSQVNAERIVQLRNVTIYLAMSPVNFCKMVLATETHQTRLCEDLTWFASN